MELPKKRTIVLCTIFGIECNQIRSYPLIEGLISTLEGFGVSGGRQ
jgi:hypothetical protein